LDIPYLSIIIFLPLIGAIVIALLGANHRRIKLTAAVFAAVSFVLSLALFCMFDRSLDGPCRGSRQSMSSTLWASTG